MRLRLRLNLLITIIMLFFIIVLSVVIMYASKQSIQEGVESAHDVTLQLLDSVIISSSQNPEWGDTHIVMRAYLEDLGRVRSNKIYLYDLQSNLLYKSPDSTYRQNETPPSWFIKFLAPAVTEDMRLIRFGRLIVRSDPIGAIKEAWAVMSNLFYITMFFILALNLIIYVLLGKWLQPINPMLSAITAMGKGNLNVRLPRFQVPDFDLISKNFNIMGQSLEKSTQENKRLGLIAQQTADAVMIHDHNLKINFWNKSAEKIFGYKSSDIIGKKISILEPRNLNKKLEINYSKLSNIIINLETQRKTKSGKLVNVSISRSPLIDPSSKKVVGDIVSMRDISEKIQALESAEALQQNRELTAIIQEHVEDERKSLARELHDELGQYVSAIKIFTQNIVNRSKGKDKVIEESASTVMSAANQIYDGMHNIIKKLRPGALDNLGLNETIIDFVNNWKKQYSKLKINLNINGDIDNLGEMININIYRIIQEAMNNCVKHAKASKVNINITRRKNNIEIQFQDNGVGFDIGILKNSKQFGLVGIEERVKSLNGDFVIHSVIDKGTTLKIKIPFI